MSANRDEIIRRIEELGGVYDPESTLSIDEQLLICETFIHSTPVDPSDSDGRTIQRLREGEDKRNGSDNGSVNGIGKRQENSEETQRKKQAISELTHCNYRTSPKNISILLEQLFSSNKSNEGHWLWIAQRYTPKSINSVIASMQKIHISGVDTIQNPPAYFTHTLKRYHHKRTLFRRGRPVEV